ncbi:hypothetical protein JCM11491_000371 [Sporobolomyces phaffii]
MESGRPPRLRRKSSAFKLSLSRASQASAYAQAVIHTPLPPPTPSFEASDPHNSTQDFTFVLPSPTAAPAPESPLLPPEPHMSTLPTAPTPNPSSSSAASVAASFPNVPSPSLTSTLELLRQLVTKRITAWTYLRNAAQGKVYWFNTILLTREELAHHFPNDRMRSRASRFTVLSMSLSSTLEISPANDFLRGVLGLVQEFEQVPEDKFASLVNAHPEHRAGAVGAGLGLGGGLGGASGGTGGGASGSGGKSGQKSLFKLSSSKSRSKSITSTSSAGGGSSSSGIGNSASGSIPGAGAGALGGPSSGGGGAGGADFAFGEGSDSGFLFVPNIPFELDYFQVLTTTCELLVEVYSKILHYLGGPSANSSAVGGGGGALSQGLAEVVLKVDSRLKKLISLLSKEIDGLARLAIRNELDLLGGGVEGWGFEGGASGAGSGGIAAGGTE